LHTTEPWSWNLCMTRIVSHDIWRGTRRGHLQLYHQLSWFQQLRKNIPV
jgi:hypothetical protein